MLTPLDVKRQQFTKQKLGGYDPEQVHAFLERVATELEAEKEKQRALENRAAELEKKLEHYERVELALQEALETARQTARVAQEAAEKRARIVLDEAELRAQEIVRDAETERHSLRQDLTRITSKQKEVAAKMRAFLLSELELLATFEGDDPVGFLKLETSSGGARQLHLRSGEEELEAEEEMTIGLFEDEEPTADEANGERRIAPQDGTREESPEERERGISGSGALRRSEASGGIDREDGTGEAGKEQFTDEDEQSVTSESPAPANDDAEIDWKAVSSTSIEEESNENAEATEDVGVDEAKANSDEPAGSDGASKDDVEIELPPVAQDDSGETRESKTWNLSKLIRGEKGASGSDTERERIRRILEDLD